MEKPKILVIDDEWNMRHLINLYLKEGRYEIDEADDGQMGLTLLHKTNYSLIILDIMLPGVDGWEVCRKIRETNKSIPILMLTARSDIKDKVYGFHTGADDYLTKPFEPEELVVRVQALLRRQNLLKGEEESSNVLHFDHLKISQDNREVLINSTKLDLTPKEFNLITLLARHPKRVFTRDILLQQIWESDDYIDIRTVDTHIKNLREKFREAGLSYNVIKTVWGVGYKFNQPTNQS